MFWFGVGIGVRVWKGSEAGDGLGDEQTACKLGGERGEVKHRRRENGNGSEMGEAGWRCVMLRQSELQVRPITCCAMAGAMAGAAAKEKADPASASPANDVDASSSVNLGHAFPPATCIYLQHTKETSFAAIEQFAHLNWFAMCM